MVDAKNHVESVPAGGIDAVRPAVEVARSFKDGFAPHVPIAGSAAADAGDARPDRFRLPKEFAQTRRTGGVERGSERQLHRLDVQFAGLAPFGKDARQQGV